MTATPVIQTQQETVRLLAQEHDLKTVSKLSGVPYYLVRQWESRRKRRALKAAGVTLSQTPVKQVADNLESELAEHERETRISLARSARRMAKDCEELPVRHADKAYTVAKTMAIVHRQDETKAQNFTLNVLNMGRLAVTVDTSEDEPAPGVSG